MRRRRGLQSALSPLIRLVGTGFACRSRQAIAAPLAISPVFFVWMSPPSGCLSRVDPDLLFAVFCLASVRWGPAQSAYIAGFIVICQYKADHIIVI